jgi:hypothetical protein
MVRPETCPRRVYITVKTGFVHTAVTYRRDGKPKQKYLLNFLLEYKKNGTVLVITVWLFSSQKLFRRTGKDFLHKLNYSEHCIFSVHFIWRSSFNAYCTK